MPFDRRYSVPLVVAFAVALVSIAGYAAWRAPRKPPVAPATAIVVSPHPDDETYGMGQTIAANVRLGRHVVGVLCSDGEASQYATGWAESDAGSDVDGDGDRDRWDFGMARRGEYRRAMAELGVTDLRFLGQAASQGATGMPDNALDARTLAERIEAIADTEGDGVAFFAPARYGGSALSSLRGDSQMRPDHEAVYNAVAEASQAAEAPAYFFGVYVYGSRPSRRVAPRFVRGTDADLAAKRRAVDAYADLGGLSTEELWSAARSDDREYLFETLP